MLASASKMGGRIAELRSRARLGAFLVGMFALACGGAHFDGREYHGKQVSFRLGPVPAGMREIRSDEALVTLRDDAVGTTVAVGARCGLDGDDVPLSALVGHLFIQFESRKETGRQEFVLDGRAALEVELDASLDGVSRHFIVVVTKKDGCVYDFMLVDGGGASGDVTRARAEFRTMVQGFSTIEPNS